MTGAMRLVVFGLSLSSSWGNGHATTYRALLRAFAARGHEVLFLERDMPWYAENRDMPEPDFCELGLYDGLGGLAPWMKRIANADAVIVGSYVPDGVAVGQLVQAQAKPVTGFYDIDTPVTMARLARGEEDYLSADLIRGYDLYLSFTGGPMLSRLEDEYGSPAARRLYCSVDEAMYRPLALPKRWDLSYLGTHSADRQPVLERLLLDAARCAPALRFAVGGPQYPNNTLWPANVEHLAHVPPAEHAHFYAQSRFTLNVTRADMVAAGYSPSVRLFEAGACGVAILSDRWEGIETLLHPGKEILLVGDTEAVLQALTGMPERERRALAAAARARVLAEHTAAHRAAELEGHLRDALAARHIGRKAGRKVMRDEVIS